MSDEFSLLLLLLVVNLPLAIFFIIVFILEAYQPRVMNVLCFAYVLVVVRNYVLVGAQQRGMNETQTKRRLIRQNIAP